jgi:hypothetical protein
MLPEVEDYYEKITGDRSLLGKLLNMLPGLHGYMENNGRREADKLLRDTVSDRLEQSRLGLSGVQQQLGHDIVMGIEYAESVGRADTLLMGLIAKIKDAPQGYSGFFDAIRVDDEVLANLYHFDEQMLNTVDQVNADVAALSKAVSTGAGVQPAIDSLIYTLQQANAIFNSRQEILRKINPQKEK